MCLATQNLFSPFNIAFAAHPDWTVSPVRQIAFQFSARADGESVLLESVPQAERHRSNNHADQQNNENIARNHSWTDAIIFNNRWKQMQSKN